MTTIDEIVALANMAESMPVHPDARFPPSLYYRFLRAYCEWAAPNRCVELGVCGGGASLHMCIGTPGYVIGVDIANNYPDQIAYIQEHYSNFEFIEMDSVEAAVYVYARHTGWDAAPGDLPWVDLLFIDTVHTYENTMAEYNVWKPLLSDGAIVCLDDLRKDGMDRVWDEMPEPKIRLDFLHVSEARLGGGFGVVVHNAG